FLLFSLGNFFLAHQCADFFGNAVSLGLQSLHFRQQFAPLLIQLDYFLNPHFIPCPARRQALPHHVGLFTNHFNVKHPAIIGRSPRRASGDSASSSLREPPP